MGLKLRRYTQAKGRRFEMGYFDKRMALDVIEDALTALGPPANRGFAIGLCGGFYLCGMLSKEEWESILARIAKCRGRVSQDSN